MRAKALYVYSDSQIVVKQMSGEYVCRSSRLYSLHWTCRSWHSFAFSIPHVPRDLNIETNDLVSSAVRKQTSKLSCASLHAFSGTK